MRTYFGWTLERSFPSGMWVATRIGELSLRADTLAGLKAYVRHVERGGKR